MRRNFQHTKWDRCMRKPHFMGSLDICKAMASKRIGHGDLLNKYTLPLISSRIKMLVDTATLPIPISHNSTSLLFLLLHGKPLLSLVEREQGTRRNWLGISQIYIYIYKQCGGTRRIAIFNESHCHWIDYNFFFPIIWKFLASWLLKKISPTSCLFEL